MIRCSVANCLWDNALGDEDCPDLLQRRVPRHFAGPEILLQPRLDILQVAEWTRGRSARGLVRRRRGGGVGCVPCLTSLNHASHGMLCSQSFSAWPPPPLPPSLPPPASGLESLLPIFCA